LGVFLDGAYDLSVVRLDQPARLRPIGTEAHGLAASQTRFHLRSGKLSDSAAAAKALEGASFAEALEPVLFHAHMPHFSSEVVGAGIQPAVQDETRAHACPKGEEDHVPAPFAGAEHPFGERAGICVVLQKGPRAEAFRKDAGHWHLVPARQIGRRLNNAFFAVQRAAATDADRLDGRRSRAGDEAPRGVNDLIENGKRSFFRGKCVFIQDAHAGSAVSTPQNDGALGPA
jgi:hypothetical protein